MTSWLVQQLLWGLASPLAAVPWVPWLLRRRPHELEWAGLSAALGYLLSMVLGALVVMAHAEPVPLTLVLAGVAAAGTVLAARTWKSLPSSGASGGWALASLLAAAITLYPRVHFQQTFGDWPRGWDPMFHLAVVRAMLLEHALPWTLAPLEDVHVNYPWGSHLAVVAQSTLSRAPPHEVFAAQNSVGLGLATLATMALFTWRWTRDRGAALGALLVLGNVMHAGGPDYQNWGGLPNHAGMMLFLAAFGLLTLEPSRAERVLGVLLLGISFLVHHHVMLTALGVLGLHHLLLAAEERRPQPLLRGALDLGLALVVAAPVTLPLLARTGELQGSSMLRYKEMYDWLTMWKDYPGAPGLVLGALGLALLGGGRDRLGPASFLAGLLLMFAVLGGAWRVHTLRVDGVPTVAMTPSRFLTDAAYPLAALGGVALARLVGRGRRAWAPALVVAPLLLGEPWVWMQFREQFESAPPAGVVDNVVKLAAHLPADAVVVADFAGSGYAPYLLGRECTDTPRPVSEPFSPRVERKKQFGKGVLAGRPDPWSRALLFADRPVWVVRDRPLPPGVVERVVLGPVRAGVLP